MEDEASAKKRKRPTLSCLPCKKRKAKCDKLFPCGTCLVRNEPDQCEYEEGSTPPPQHAYVAQSDFQSLQARVARLESELKSMASSSPLTGPGATPRRKSINSYNHPSTGTTSSTPAADVEPTIHAIEILATNLFANAKKHGALYGVKGKDYDKDAELMHSASTVWPSIIDPLNTRRMARAKWTRGMTEIMTALPRKEVVDALFNVIMNELQMPPALSGQMIPTSIFKEELQQFHMLRDIGQHCAIDAGWLAHLTSVLWFVVGYCIRHPALTPPILLQDGTDLQELGVTLYEAMETALYCAEAMFRPQLRVFMALLMAIPLGVRGPGLMLTPYANTGTRVMLYDLAVGIVKGFQMNQLEGPESGVELPRDPALPRDKPRLSWQLLSRTFGAFVFLDSFAMAWMPGHSPAFDTPLIHTDSPMNVDIEELLEDDSAASKPLTELTDTTWEIHMAGMSKAWRRILQYLALPDEERTYPRMLEIDTYARLCFDHIGNMEGRERWDDVNKMTWHALRSGWMQRFLRLHRPWLVKSIESESKEFEQSYDTCLSFSTSIMRNHRHVIEHYSHTAVSRDFVPIYSHHLSAVIILFIVGLLKPSLRADMLGEIRGSLEVFRQVAQPDHEMYARVGPKGYGVIRSMIQILESPASSSLSFDKLLAEVERQAAAAPAPNMPSAGNIASIVMNPMLKSLDTVDKPLANTNNGSGFGSASGFALESSSSNSYTESPTNNVSMRTTYQAGPQSSAAAVAMGAPPSTWSRDDRGFAVPIVPPIYSNQRYPPMENQSGPLGFQGMGGMTGSGIGYEPVTSNGSGNGDPGQGQMLGGYQFSAEGTDGLMGMDAGGNLIINPDLSLSGMDFDWDSLFKSF